MHRLLMRQLKKLDLAATALPADLPAWQQLLARISQTYTEADQDRYLLERSLSISSTEMQDLYEKLRQSSETRIAAERDKLQAVVSSVGDGLCALDQDGNLLFINPEGERLLGWPEAELVGQPVLERVEVRDEGEPARARFSLHEMVGSGQPYRNEDGRFWRKDGASFPVAYVVNPIVKEGKVLGAVLVFRDITERRRLLEEAQRRIAELSTLNEMSQAASVALTLDDLLEMVYRQVSRLFDTTNFYIAIYEEGSDEWTAVFDLESGQRQPRVRYSAGQGVTGHIIHTRQPILLRTYQEGVAFDEEHGVPPLGPRSRSWMGVPLIAADKVVGVMAIQSYEQEGLYNDQDLTLFTTIAAPAAIAIENARLFEEAQRLAATVQELSAPVIQVWDQVLVLPLIGGMDEARSHRIMETLLNGITQHHAQVVIIDVTGVPLVDSRVADHLLHTARAAELLGAHCVLTGISPKIAQSIVSLGLPLTKLTTLPNLQAGIRHALALLRRTG